MSDYSKEIIRKINELIDLASADPKTIKLLLELKLVFLRFLAESKAAKLAIQKRETDRRIGKMEKTEEKEGLILKFIEKKGGRVGMDDLVTLGISGRSLRRYLKDLRKRGLITIEKRGREHFYILVR